MSGVGSLSCRFFSLITPTGLGFILRAAGGQSFGHGSQGGCRGPGVGWRVCARVAPARPARAVPCSGLTVRLARRRFRCAVWWSDRGRAGTWWACGRAPCVRFRRLAFWAVGAGGGLCVWRARVAVGSCVLLFLEWVALVRPEESHVGFFGGSGGWMLGRRVLSLRKAVIAKM